MRPAARLGAAWESGILRLVQLAAEGVQGPAVRSAEVAAGEGELPAPGEIRAAARAAGIDARRATLALGGDAVVVKPVTLPPVPPETRLAILRQEGERYFLLPPPPRCYGLWPATDEAGAWAVAAAEPQVDALVATLEAAGIAVQAVTLGPILYRDALGFLLAGDGPPPEAMVRSVDGAHELVATRAGRLIEYRRVEGAPDWRAALEKGGLPAGELGLVADPLGVPPPVDARSPVVVPPPGPVERPARLLGALGAALADPARGELPDLLPRARREGRHRASARRTAGLAAAVALFLVLFGGLWTLRQDRREARLIEELTVLRAEAEPVVAMRAELERISRELVAHRRLAGEGTDWLALLSELSLALPRDAWLASLQARDDGAVVVTGYAHSASDVLSALAASPELGDVRFETQTSRTQVGGRPVESFSLAVGWIDAPE